MVEPRTNAPLPSAVRLEERIYQDLLGRIQSSLYVRGQRLPPEVELSMEFGVSRPVIRGALARLREAGLIVSRKGAGSFVNPEPEPGVPPATASGGGLGPLGSIDDIASFYDFRRILEAEVAARTARRCRPVDIASLNDMLAAMDASIAAGKSTVEQDIHFHCALARLSGNRFLEQTMAMVSPHMRSVGSFVSSLSPAGFARHKQHMQTEHRRLMDALASGDAAAARSAMTQHINGSEQRIFKGSTNAD